MPISQKLEFSQLHLLSAFGGGLPQTQNPLGTCIPVMSMVRLHFG